MQKWSLARKYYTKQPPGNSGWVLNSCGGPPNGELLLGTMGFVGNHVFCIYPRLFRFNMPLFSLGIAVLVNNSTKATAGNKRNVVLLLKLWLSWVRRLYTWNTHLQFPSWIDKSTKVRRQKSQIRRAGHFVQVTSETLKQWSEVRNSVRSIRISSDLERIWLFFSPTS